MKEPAPKRVAGGRIRREPSFLIFWTSGPLEGCHRLGCSSSQGSSDAVRTSILERNRGALGLSGGVPDVDHQRSTSLA